MENINLISLKVVKEKSIKYNFEPVTKPKDIFHLVKELVGDTDREYFLVIHVDVKNKPTSIEIAFIGTLTEASVHPREIFKSAILTNANQIIISHTHPSGSAEPSYEDRVLTKRLKEAAELIGIPIMDHIIVGDDYYSFVENGEL